MEKIKMKQHEYHTRVDSLDKIIESMVTIKELLRLELHRLETSDSSFDIKADGYMSELYQLELDHDLLLETWRDVVYTMDDWLIE